MPKDEIDLEKMLKNISEIAPKVVSDVIGDKQNFAAICYCGDEIPEVVDFVFYCLGCNQYYELKKIDKNRARVLMKKK